MKREALRWKILGMAFVAGLAACRAPEPPATLSGTARMVDTLAAIYRRALADPMAYYLLNSQRAEWWHRQLEQTGSSSLSLRFNYARELLAAGQTEAAIRELQALLARFGTYEGAPETRQLLEALATAYFRLGEQQNCLALPHPEACILPLQGGGIHRHREAVQQAAALWERLLESRPFDFQTRWLLNLAYMAMGRYPDGVPPRWRIDGLEPARPVTPSFRNVAMARGVDVVGLAGGVSAEDFNGDGWIDLLVTSYGLNDQVRLFLADGQGGFVDHTEAAGLKGIVGGLNTVHADYDNDGDVDVLILRGAWLGPAGRMPNSLLRNNGDGTFTDVTYEAGLGYACPTQTAAFADFNLDGWVDLFVGCESNWMSAWAVGLGGLPEDQVVDFPCALYVNNGDGTFTDIAPDVGLDLKAMVKGVAWGDVNNDGLPDLYVSVLGGPNRLFVNRGGTDPRNWRFEEVAEQAGVTGPLFSFPVWFFDYNQDGLEDLFVASFDLRYLAETPAEYALEWLGIRRRSEPPALYRNNGDGTFTDVTREVGLDRACFTMSGNFGDLNSDGWPDMYWGTGTPDFRALVPNRLFMGRGGTFEDVTLTSGTGHLQKGHGVAMADFDRDGDLDMYVVLGGAYESDVFPNALFENGQPSGNWIQLRLVGRQANRAAIGARIRLVARTPDGRRRVHYATVSSGGSFGASPLMPWIGLGDATHIDTLEIRWPTQDGRRTLHFNLEVNRTYVLEEGQR
ncbi:FG-GAP-like repeat-containing protein [Rhodothermus marinus]|uniref:FG-GAP-like repeat-containing protein n=1 Tax=Rhodothermus marinus TaxID=29549 RepID=UPI0037C66CAB